MTFDDFLDLMEPLEMAMAEKFTPDRAKVFYVALCDLTREQLAAAVATHIRTATSAFLPMPGVLRKLAVEHSAGEPLDADSAWGNLLRLVREFGVYQSEQAQAAMDEATRYAVAACGGFLECCEISEDNKAAYRKSFRDAYTAHQTRRKQAAVSGMAPRLPADQQAMLEGQQRRIEGHAQAVAEVPEPVRLTAAAMMIPEPAPERVRKSFDELAAEGPVSLARQQSALREMIRLTKNQEVLSDG